MLDNIRLENLLIVVKFTILNKNAMIFENYVWFTLIWIFPQKILIFVKVKNLKKFLIDNFWREN